MSNRLERLHGECKKYHFKKFLKSFLLFTSVLVLVTGGYYAYALYQLENITKPEPKSVTKAKEDYTLRVSSNDVAKAVAKMKTQSLAQKKQVVVVKQPKKTPVFVKSVPKETMFSDITQEKSLDGWIEKYNQKKSYSLAIYISKQYYFDSEYKSAGIWAKRANQLDRNKEEAWLYYAKSVSALGDIKKAKRILNVFLQYKDSTKAELLLSEWSREGN